MILVLILCLLIPAAALAAYRVTVTMDVSNASQLKAALYDKVKEINSGSTGTHLVVNIKADFDMGSVSWDAQTINSYGRYFFLTIKGNGHTISGMNNMLVAGTWAGKGGVEINGLTLSDANIVFDKDDTNGSEGVGAFIGKPSSSGGHILLEDCHLVDSHVEGGHWTGGLIGYTSGYSGNDGPVFMNVDIKNCSVEDSTITGKGSVGGVIGHGLGDAWTGVTISDTNVTGNTITSTGSSKEKAGDIVGTVGTAGNSAQPSGKEKKTGFLVIENTVAKDNTTTSGGKEIERIYGRTGTATEITIDGGLFDQYETAQDENLGNMTIKKINNPVFLENMCKVTVKDGANGEVFADYTEYWPRGKEFFVDGIPVRPGYVFKGWSPALPAVVSSDAVFTAMWESESSSNAAPVTGDSTPLLLMSVLLIISGLALVFVATKRKAGQN